MGYPSMNKISQYSQVGSESGINDASPHRLVQMLFEGVLKKIAMAKGLMLRKETAKKGELIGQAIAILMGLHASLDKESGGQLAENLSTLYDYMGRQLLQANIKNNPEYLDEVVVLLKEIKAGWDAIPQELRQNSPPEPAAVHG